MTITDPARCPRCGTRRATSAASLDLCPVCLLTAALSMGDEPWPYQVTAPMGEDSRGATYLAQRLARARHYAAPKIHAPLASATQVLSTHHPLKPQRTRALPEAPRERLLLE